MAYRDKNKERKTSAEYKRKVKKANHDYIRSYKEYHKCSECDEGRAVCLDLHHIHPHLKSFELSTVKTHSIGSIDAELNKCVVLCANCHRLRHAEHRQEEKRIEIEEEKTLFTQ